MLSQSQYQSMVNFERLTQSLILFNAWNLWLMLHMMHLTYQWKLLMRQFLLTWIDQSHQQRMGSIAKMSSYQNSNSHLKIQILDLVFDVYNENSLKSQIRENRGGGMRKSACKVTPICNDFQKFMRNDTNKTELFKIVAEAVIQIPETLATIVATIGSKIVSNSSLESWTLSPAIMKRLTQDYPYTSLMELIQALKKSP